MNSGAIAETVGLAGIIGSLIFVGLEVRQGAAATRSATVLQLKDSWVQLNLANATSLELAHAWEQLEDNGWEKSDFRSRRMTGGFTRTLFNIWSNAFYQYRNGTLEEEQWLPHRREMRATTDPITRIVWRDWKHAFDEPFQQLFDGILETASSGDKGFISKGE